MNRNHSHAWIALAVLVCVGPAPAPAEELPPPDAGQPSETRADVPALHEFHTVIRTIWHEAWPNRDCATLRTLLPEVQEGADSVAHAELPGILRDKKAAWSEGVKELEATVAAYAAAAEGKEDQALLDAAERLHAQFERLVRIIRPALEELDAFHVVLYRIYHYDMHANDLVSIRASVAKLKEPMAALDRASLPKNREKLQEEFSAARKKLSAAVNRLVSVSRSDDLERVKQAIEEVHDRYQALAAVFD